MGEFNPNKYKYAYGKEHYKPFIVHLKKEEKDEITEYLKLHNISQAEFLRDSFKRLKVRLERKK